MPRLFYAVLLVSSFTVMIGATSPVAADRVGAEQSGCSSAPPILQLANPNPGDVIQRGDLMVSGLAYDPAATNGAGIARVDLFLGDRDSGGTILGSTAQGGNSSSLDRQFLVKASLPSNATGGHDFVAYAYSSMTGEWTRASVPVFIGVAPTPTPNNDTHQMPVPLRAALSFSCGAVVANLVGSVPQPDECVGPLHTPPATRPAGFIDGPATVDDVDMDYVIGGNGHQGIDHAASGSAVHRVSYRSSRSWRLPRVSTVLRCENPRRLRAQVGRRHTQLPACPRGWARLGRTGCFCVRGLLPRSRIKPHDDGFSFLSRPRD